MPARIRLQRHGRKGRPFFHIVVADQRAKRDGRFIEKLGTYDPNTNPATINLDFDRSVHWVGVGAQPSDTARAILSYKGVLMKEHLMRGVAKGALTEKQMEAKFNKWLEDKTSIIDSKLAGIAKQKADEDKVRLAAEKEKNEARAAAIAEANKPVEEVSDTTNEEAPAEDVGAEQAADEVKAEVTVEAAGDVADVAKETEERAVEKKEEPESADEPVKEEAEKKED